MKQVLLKIIVIVVDKLTRSRVLQGGVGLHGALRGGDRVRQDHVGQGRRPHPSNPPYFIAIPSQARVRVRVQVRVRVRMKDWTYHMVLKFHQLEYTLT